MVEESSEAMPGDGALPSAAVAPIASEVSAKSESGQTPEASPADEVVSGADEPARDLPAPEAIDEPSLDDAVVPTDDAPLESSFLIGAHPAPKPTTDPEASEPTNAPSAPESPPSSEPAVADPPPPALEGTSAAIEADAPPAEPVAEPDVPPASGATLTDVADPPADPPPASDFLIGAQPATAEAVVEPATPVTPAQPVPAAKPRPATAIRSPRGIPPLLQFAAWRLLELVATVAIAWFLLGLILPGTAAADAGSLADRLGVTVPLIALSLAVAGITGLPLGYAAARGTSGVDALVRGLSLLGASLHPAWLATLLVLLVALSLQWLQPGGFVPWSDPIGALASLLLPALALGLPLGAEVAGRMRDAFKAALADPAMETADMLGYSRAEAIRSFALRQAIGATARRLSLPLALLVPMTLIIEAVYYLPGLGRLIFTALAERDFGTLQLGLVMLVALVAFCRLLGRLLEAACDPRIARGT